MEKTAEKRRELQCRIYPLSTLSPYKYVVVCSRYEGKWLLSRHKRRATWETQGGHIEPGETPMQAALRELYEESGVKDASVYPVCDYYGYDSDSSSNGVVFLADIRHLGVLPESEMKETKLFAELPEDLTYPSVTPRLMEEASRLYGRLQAEKILAQMGMDGAEVSVFQREEDGSDYEVWKVSAGGRDCVLKKAKGHELAVYSAFFSSDTQGAPRFLKSANVDAEDYFLMEYARGEDLCQCTREKLTKALDALITLQNRYWGDEEHQNVGFSFSESLKGRENRGKFLKDAELEQAYAAYLTLYKTLPRTLCHDDLLPFNVLVSDEGAALIDWEYAGILPYPTSLARLIAHGSEDENAFFSMKEEDKAFAVDYYYEHLLRGKGIDYREYRSALDYFLFYEYCEWIMLGNKYDDADMERYRQYYAKAKAHLQAMKQEDPYVLSIQTDR